MIHIPPPTLLIPQLPTLAQQPLLHALKLGQILQARVLSENLDGQIKLSIGDSKLTAQTPMQVTSGQKLTLQVIRTGPLPELKLLSQTEPLQLQAEALKRFLPKQRPLTELFEKLSPIANSPSRTPAQDQIKPAVQALLARLPALEHPQFRQSLKTALFDSGLFTERLLVDQQAHGNDLKINLLRLYEQVKNLLPQQDLPPEHKPVQGRAQDSEAFQTQPAFRQLTDLLKQLDGAIARIHTHQLASLPQDDPTRQVWQFEIPLLHQEQADVHQMTIKREGGGPGAEHKPVWSLTLQMNLQPLGPMRVQLRLEGKALATLIWAERQGTMQLLEQHLPELQQAFEQADLEVVRLQVYQAKITQPETIPQVEGLLREKA